MLREKNEVTCSRCKNHFKYNGNISNMRLHLSSLHPRDFAAIEREEKEDASYAFRKHPRIQTSVKLKSTPVENQFPALFEARQPLTYQGLTDSVCYFIAKDTLPFDMANSSGFLQLVNAFEPLYQPPDRKMISTHCIQNLYEQEKTRVQQQLNNLEWCATTTEMDIMC